MSDVSRERNPLALFASRFTVLNGFTVLNFLIQLRKSQS